MFWKMNCSNQSLNLFQNLVRGSVFVSARLQTDVRLPEIQNEKPHDSQYCGIHHFTHRLAIVGSHERLETEHNKDQPDNEHQNILKHLIVKDIFIY